MIEPVRAALGKRYEQQLAACDDPRQFALGMRTAWGGRPLDPDRDDEATLIVIFSRSFNTFCAAVELARMGFGQQAAMLNRSLFEDMIDGHWVTLEPELAVQRLEEHHLQGRMLLADAVRDEGLLPEDDIPSFDATRREELDKVFGPYGERSWTGRNLHARANDVKHLWGDEDGQEGLRFVRHRPPREQPAPSPQRVLNEQRSSGKDR